MSTDPTGAPGGIESPAERTDPLLPVITDHMVPPDGLPPLAARRVPTLDDATLAAMLAELEVDEPGRATVVTSAAAPGTAPETVAHPAPWRIPEPAAAPDAGPLPETGPPPQTGPPTETAPRPAPEGAGPAAPRDTRYPGVDCGPPSTSEIPDPATTPRSVDAMPSPRGPRPGRPVPRPAGAVVVNRYVRRDYHPVPPPADAQSLTGLSRHARGRLGSRLFTVVFVAIFVLILVQAVVSLLGAA